MKRRVKNSVAAFAAEIEAKAQERIWDKVKELALDYLYETQGETVDDLIREHRKTVSGLGYFRAQPTPREKALQILEGFLDSSQQTNASLPDVKKLSREVLNQPNEESAREVAYWAIRQRLMLG